ncbi:AmmeMemoRadiSam system protein B [Planosporangium sp. 12N6]|uniref:AmmeMemoRadiSam system protein B n=1 Tax=Planosporangium spinosum TaxID=3402278 RepID=UPI003CF15139
MRPPAVAGLFYPADPRELAAEIDDLLEAVAVPDDDVLAPAYVVPHAGYRYSGPTAAQVYARLRAHAAEVDRVVVAGPSHRQPVRGCVVPGAQRWDTPLGGLPVDRRAESLASAGYAAVDDVPHAAEHSLEVQLPFLRRALGEVPVLPVVVGRAEPADVADAVRAAVAPDPAGTVVLCSTDLSHYLPDERARRHDRQTLRAVDDLAADAIGVSDACGVFALRGLVEWARRDDLRARLLDYSTSAESTGDPTRVVGYAAIAFAPD